LTVELSGLHRLSEHSVDLGHYYFDMDIQAAVDYVTDWGMVNFAGKHWRITYWRMHCSGIQGDNLGDTLMLAV